jgi:predicted DCC family thiol-disulfide oxidoreductase YuxK
LQKNKYTILYDSNCPLCVRFKQGLSHLLPSDFLFRSIQDENTLKDFPQFTQEQLQQTVHMVSDAGEVFTGAQLIEVIAHHTPIVSKFAWLLETGMGHKATEFFYEKINQIKQQIAEKCESCNKS